MRRGLAYGRRGAAKRLLDVVGNARSQRSDSTAGIRERFHRMLNARYGPGGRGASRGSYKRGRGRESGASGEHPQKSDADQRRRGGVLPHGILQSLEEIAGI